MDGVITLTAKTKAAQARAGDITLPAVAQMAFGDGGTDDHGNPLKPLPADTALGNELLRKSVTCHTYPTATTCRYACTLITDELTGEVINEVALYDADGDMVCRKTFPDKVKSAGIEMTFEVDDVF
jgi:phage-related tail fiber protein